ncbi:AsmA family protein [Rhizobium sp. RCAM05350]|nr:AsmA family protein [Rhizobium sp. RCAM05350]
MDRALLNQFSLDLRLSAQEASYGSVALTDLAAGVMVENGRASVDIGDGTFAGGSISGRIALANDSAEGGQLQLALKNADLAPVAASLGLTGPLPLGRGVLSVDLSTAEPLSQMTAAGASGEFRYSANNGTVANFDLPEFERLAAQGHVFNVSHATNGSSRFYEGGDRCNLAQRRCRANHGEHPGRRKNLVSCRHRSLQERETGACRRHPAGRSCNACRSLLCRRLLAEPGHFPSARAPYSHEWARSTLSQGILR